MKERRELSKGAVVFALLLQMMLICPASLAEVWWDSNQLTGYYQGCGEGYIATVWDLRAQRSVLNAGNREQIDAASISPDGLRVVTLTHWKSEAFTWKLPRG